MIGLALSVIVAVLAAIGSVFSIAPHLNGDSFLRVYSPVGRALFAAILALLSVTVGWHAINEAREKNNSDHRPQVGSDVSALGEGRSMPAQPVNQANGNRARRPTPTLPRVQPAVTNTDKTTNPRIRIQDDSGDLVPGLMLIAQRDLPSDVLVEGTLHMTTTAPDDALQGLITANAALSVTLKSGEHLIDGFDLDTRGGGFTAEAAIRQARERLEAEFTKRLKEHS
jgi:hypothetical protein